MHWCDEVIDPLLVGGGGGGGAGLVINDSKTPSGRAHVGALRGPLIHDAVFRVLKERGVGVSYRFGVDDYDPVDELPAGMKEQYAQYLGQPLCNTPAPKGSTASDMADHFITEYFSVFKDLGIGCTFYRMRDIYRGGVFNEAIDRILKSAPLVREIYKKVSNSDRPGDWHPFQTICEQCGRIGTTEVTAYDGKEVTYRCRPDLVTWAKGCGHSGKVSPFDGRGKLPWKLEWVAKWATFPVSIEGAGEDHNTKGGSRDVACHCLEAIYGQRPPVNIPYGFLLIGGAKMSSSKGLGAAARDVADFIPPEILRFVMIRGSARRQANFDVTEEGLVKLFNDFDRAHKKTFADPKFPEAEKRSYLLSEVRPEGAYFDCEFSLVLALVQMPHLDLVKEFEKLKGSGLTEVELGHLRRREHAARFFLANYATDEERLTIQQSLPARAGELSVVQRGFLHTLAGMLSAGTQERNAEGLQTTVFDAARATPIDQASAFSAIYRVLLDKGAGPKAGNLFAFLEKGWLVERLRAVGLDRGEFVRATVVPVAEVVAWLGDAKVKVVGVSGVEDGGVVELRVRTGDEKVHVRRVAGRLGEVAGEIERATKMVVGVVGG